MGHALPTQLAGKTVLVTGSSGFIASTMVPMLLDANMRVTGLDRLPNVHIAPHQNFTFIQKDIDDLVDVKGFDYVIHLAFATSIPGSISDPIGTTYNNIDLGVKMLELSKQAGVKKFLYPSTASLYGNQVLPWNEEMPVFPSEPYSVQKYSLERYCRYYAENGLPTVIFRLFQVFGENQRQDTALAKFYRLRAEGLPITITRPTDGSDASPKRDFIYTGDISQAFAMALVADAVGKGEIINLASGFTYTIREIAELISPKIEFIPRRGYDLDEHLADVRKAKNVLEWTATTDIKDWLKRYLNSLDSPH